MKKKILITGGQGFLGGRLASYFFHSPNYEVAVTSRSSISKFAALPVKVLQVNTQKDDLAEVLKGFHTVIHLAALDASSCIEKPYEAIEVNIADTLRWKIAAEKADVTKFIYFSTIHVYGNQELDILEENSLTLPHHPYAISHLSAEQYILAPSYNKKTSTYVFRLSNSFGFPATEMNQWHLVVLDFCKQAAIGDKILIKSNSIQKRDFIPISTISETTHSFLESNFHQGVYNLCSGENKTLLEIALYIQKIANQKFNREIEIIEEAERAVNNVALISNKKLKKLVSISNEKFEIEMDNIIHYCFTKPFNQ